MARARRREIKATYHGSVSFDAVNGANVAVPVAKVEVGLDRILITWQLTREDQVTGRSEFSPVFRRRGVLAVFDGTEAVVFETEASPYQVWRGGCFLDRHWPERQGRLVLTTEG